MADDRKTPADWLHSKLDRDGDGKLTANDVKRGIVDLLDADGDGQVSLEEVEGGVVNAWDWLERAFLKLQQATRPFRGILIFSFGTFVCFYGKNFTYTILFGQVFRVSGWPVVKKGCLELKQSYGQARGTLKKELPTLTAAAKRANAARERLASAKAAYEGARSRGDAKAAAKLKDEVQRLSADVDVLSGASSSLTALSKSVDPAKVADIMKGIYTGLIACLASAMSTAAKQVGIGVQVGSVVANTMETTVMPFLRKHAFNAAQASPELQALSNNAAMQRWVDAGLHALCRMAAVAVAHFYETRMFVVANALTGAELMTSQLAKWVERHSSAKLTGTPTLAMMQYALCFAGASTQILGRGGDLPWMARFVLFAPLFAEKWLAWAAAGVRGHSLFA